MISIRLCIINYVSSIKDAYPHIFLGVFPVCFLKNSFMLHWHVLICYYVFQNRLEWEFNLISSNILNSFVSVFPYIRIQSG